MLSVVFIHGLTGHRENTWTSPTATDPWPKSLLPARISNVRVLTFGYDATIADWRSILSNNIVGNHAQDLLNALADLRGEDDSNARPIIFVCHSIGGLVCEYALVSSSQHPEKHLRAVSQSTKGIIFLGTPHHSPGLAVRAERLCGSIGILWQVDLSTIRVLRQDSEVLSRTQDSFHTMIQSRNSGDRRPVEITCFYEELLTSTVGIIVPQESAMLPGYRSIGIRSNHQDMTKFASPEEAGFMAICAEIQRWVKEMSPLTAVCEAGFRGHRSSQTFQWRGGETNSIL
ncbi:hypothetical protein CMUS01_06243 [Colletotrichum musicola]|uniref:AB hydrolase-1 domain-containing protein n=1 Tax=Colletotrichum musicola TaxID=2175873 RepID=A0A8H6KNM4_9PEZI|nr:hypothetical protein CMUS01_06243 [Colletotrichum musicola]